MCASAFLCVCRRAATERQDNNYITSPSSGAGSCFHDAIVMIANAREISRFIFTRVRSGVKTVPFRRSRVDGQRGVVETFF